MHYVFISDNLKPHSLEFMYLEGEDSYTRQVLPWLQNLNFKFGALRREKRRVLAFYTRTSCLRGGGVVVAVAVAGAVAVAVAAAAAAAAAIAVLF